MTYNVARLSALHCYLLYMIHWFYQTIIEQIAFKIIGFGCPGHGKKAVGSVVVKCDSFGVFDVFGIVSNTVLF